MIDLEDDATPLLNPFSRNSSLRIASRRKVYAPSRPPDDVHARPPLPPRPQGLAPLLRSYSVTEGEDNWGRVILPQDGEAAQAPDSKGCESQNVPHRPDRFTQLPCGAMGPAEHGDDHGSSGRDLQRNGPLSVSLPPGKKSRSGILARLSSPLATRRAKVKQAAPPRTELDVSGDPKLFNHSERPATSYRKPQTKLSPRSAIVPPPYTHKATPTSERPQCNLTRHDSIPKRNNSYSPQQTRNNLLGRSTSFRSRPSGWPNVNEIVTRAERICNNTSPSPGTEAPLANHQNQGWERQQAPRGVRRHSSLPRPSLIGRNSPVEPKIHGRSPSPARRGDNAPPAATRSTTPTPPSPSTPTTPSTPTRGPSFPTTPTGGPFSPRSFRRCESLNLEVSSRCRLSRIERARESSRDGGGNSNGLGDGYYNKSVLTSRTSSDSGYSTCSSVSRRSSIVSVGEEGMIEWFGSRLNLEEEPLPTEPARGHFFFLLEKEEEYLQCLESMLKDYKAMCSKTPSLIRQHFDLIFREISIIYHFHQVLQEDLQETHGDPQQLARVFRNEQFQCYGRLMVMTPAAQKDLVQHASHIKEHFPDLRRNILKPALRINFYAMILDSIKKEASPDTKVELHDAIDFLNQVKRKANTEMTLSTVVHSPVDLRLGGDMLHIGELTYTGGGTLQKRKYQLILFEHLLVITSKKIELFKYKIHYRVEQLESVRSVGDNELLLHVLSEGQKQLLTHKFWTKHPKIRDEWISELEKITKHNTRLCRGRNSITQRIPRQQYQMLPLDLGCVFPLVKAVVNTQPERTESTAEMSLSYIKDCEDRYIRQLSATLNPELSRPPGELSNLLGNLYKVHTKLFLPALKRFKTVSDFLDFLVENLDELSVYEDYLVVRSQLTVELDNTPQAGEYILPVQHMYGVYFGLMKELSKTDKCRSAAQRIIERLQKHVESAQLRVQDEAISNGRVDFQRSGKLILYTRLEVKSNKKDIRAGDYTGLLFENVLILTRRKRPYYEHVMDIWLDQANLGRPTSHDCTFRLEVRQGRKKEPITYEMCTTSPENKKMWQNHLHEQLMAQVNKIRLSWMRST